MNKSHSLASLLLMLLSSLVFAQPNVETEFFTQAQEEYFADHLDDYAYFSVLYVDKKTPEQIKRKHHLSTEESIQYLNNLANIGVIQKPSSNDLSLPISFLVQGVSRFRDDGPLSKKVSGLMARQIFEKVEQGIKSNKLKFRSLGLWITNKQHQAYLKELHDLENKYIDISVQNKQSNIKGAHRVFGVMVLIPHWEPSLFYNIKQEK